MMNERDFEAFAKQLATDNEISIELAREYAAAIGDTPELGEDGLAVVRDTNGVAIATLKISTDA